MTTPNAGAWPIGLQRWRFWINGTQVEITLDWTHVKLLALNASRNKGGKSQAGPVKAVRLP